MELLRIEETADRLRVSRRTVYRLVDHDTSFPRPLRIGAARVVFDASAIDAWLRRQVEKEASMA